MLRMARPGSIESQFLSQRFSWDQDEIAHRAPLMSNFLHEQYTEIKLGFQHEYDQICYRKVTLIEKVCLDAVVPKGMYQTARTTR